MSFLNPFTTNIKEATMSFGHDPEVPAGFQDADVEMAEMREAANEAYSEAYPP